MLIELPDGNWIDPKMISGLRMMDDREFGPRVVIDTPGQVALFFFRFDDAEAARGWMKKFAADCNIATYHTSWRK